MCLPGLQLKVCFYAFGKCTIVLVRSNNISSFGVLGFFPLRVTSIIVHCKKGKICVLLKDQ